MKTQISFVVGLTLLAGAPGWAQTAPPAGKDPADARKTAENPFAETGARPPEPGDASAARDPASPAGGGRFTTRISRIPRGYGGTAEWGAYPEWYSAGAIAAGPGAVSVTVFGKAEQEALDETAEDLRILSFLISRKLEQALAGDAPDYKLGIPMLVTANGHAVEASYVQGFGAVLKMRVAFPLMAPPGGEKGAGSIQGGSDWDEARRALAGAVPPGGGEVAWTSGRGTGYGFARGGEAARYDPKLVEALKKRLLALLRNASNLRHVEAGEYIVVSITGQPNVPSGQAVQPDNAPALADPLTVGRPAARRPGTSTGISNKLPSEDVKAGEAPNAGDVKEAETPDFNRATVMTLRVKKSNADAFAAGRLPEEQFVEEAVVTTYLGPLPPEGVRGRSPYGRRMF